MSLTKAIQDYIDKERRRRLYNTRQTPYNVLHGCHSTNYFEYKN